MAEAGARAQRVAERRQQILDAARAMAEADGWTAVTSRRLADAIGYTQPVLYGHFPGGKTEIMRTVALAGFAELAMGVHVNRFDPFATDHDRQFLLCRLLGVRAV